MLEAFDEHRQIVSATLADREKAYFCICCEKPVFLKPSDVKEPHFCHYTGKYECDLYHKSNSSDKYLNGLYSEHRNQLSEKQYQDRWNSVISYIIHNDLLSYYLDFPLILRPLATFISEFEGDVVVLLCLLDFIKKFSKSELTEYSISIEDIRNSIFPQQVFLHPQRTENGEDARKIKEDFKTQFARLNNIKKFESVIRMLKSDDFSKDKMNSQTSSLLRQTRLTNSSYSGMDFFVPFSSDLSADDILLIVAHAKQERISKLMASLWISFSQRTLISNYVKTNSGHISRSEGIVF